MHEAEDSKGEQVQVTQPRQISESLISKNERTREKEALRAVLMF